MMKLGKTAYIAIAATVVILAVIGVIVYVIVHKNNVTTTTTTTKGLLYPHESETREVMSLDGMWNFAMSDPNNPSEGVQEKWFLKELWQSVNITSIPVPASYNDLDQFAKTRDHVGTVWYERTFYVPNYWREQRVWLRFASVHYIATVWINGKHVVEHTFGHLPFEVDITNQLNFASENRVTVLCDNTLTPTSVPQGEVLEQVNDDGNVLVQKYAFDFFNYAGIHRSVHLYTTPITHVKELEIETSVDSAGHGHVHFSIIPSEGLANSANVSIYDRNGNVVASQAVDGTLRGEAVISNVRMWWPYLMDSDPGYLYTIEVRLSTKAQEDIDIYRMKFGVRTLKWTDKTFLINERPVYFRGFGKHEDSDFRGKGFDFALLTRDFNLLRWIGANAYRTTHYPYSEESMQFADEHGIMIIDECAFVQTNVDLGEYNEELLENHKSNIEQLIHRDRNHPSVVMWSIANEPRSGLSNADWYFDQVSAYTKQLDSSRPITSAIDTTLERDAAGKYMDILSFNRYNAWYTNTGRLDMITKHVVDEARQWHEKYLKPVLMSEYGADTLAGLHLLPAFVWTEEFQVQLFSQHFEAFDKLRNEGFFIGEFVWNFADFKTFQDFNRVNGNKKGVFTRGRQPKAAAHLLRKRYFDLAMEIDRLEEQPDDVNEYISPLQESFYRTEL